MGQSSSSSPAPPVSEQVTQNYEQVGKVYEKALFYEPGPYNEWLADEVGAALDLGSTNTLADVGGGTGSFTQLLISRSQGLQAIVVEPSTSMLDKAKERGLETSLIGANEFAAAEGADCPSYDRILLKEVVHHLDDRVNMFAGMRRRLQPGGRILIVTRPKEDIDYPFFAAAKTTWIEHQPDPTEYVQEMLKAGFPHAQVLGDLRRYPCSSSTQDWFSFIRNRGWSTFAHYSDDELNAGCEEIKQQFNGLETLHFEDRLVFVEGRLDVN